MSSFSPSFLCSHVEILLNSHLHMLLSSCIHGCNKQCAFLGADPKNTEEHREVPTDFSVLQLRQLLSTWE